MNIPKELPGSASGVEEECNNKDETMDLVADVDYRKYIACSLGRDLLNPIDC